MRLRRLLPALTLLLPMTDPLAAQATDDPYRWLEAVSAESSLAWVRGQNARSTGALTTDPGFAPLSERILSILDSDAKIPYVEKIGPHYYNLWRDAAHPRGLWRRTTLAEYRTPAPAWETVIDLDALGAAEGENWVWHGAACLQPAYRRCLVSLSRGGADADVVREFDLVTRQFLPGGFTLPEAKSNVAWRDDDAIFVGTDVGPGSMTTSGYPRLVQLWRRGTPLAEAETVYEGRPDDVWAYGWRDLTRGFEREFVARGITFYSNEMFLRRDGVLHRIPKPDDANASVFREWLLLELRSDWTVAGRTWPAGALLATRFEDFLAGGGALEALFLPTDRKSLAGFSVTRHHVVVNELDNVRNRLYVLTWRDGVWQRAPLPGVPEFGAVGMSAVDPEESDAYFLTITDFLTPTSLAYGTVGGGPAERLKQLPAFFSADGLRVSQHEAVSADGTRVPYFEVARRDLSRDARHPTLLYGYGGFEVSMLPSYSASVGAAWLEPGGVYVLANIRGGGEFGPRWHQAALKANRHKAYEDFIAVAEDLIRRGVTRPAQLGIMGGSNGGLLMGNMLTRRPDLFGAIVCQVPLLDMRQYHTLLAGASWMGEYGNPDDPAEWEFIRTFSPYHNVREGVTYPPTLFTTSTRDDRVHPGHARKMVARMLEQRHDVLYYENIEGGHAGAADNRQAAFMSALAWTFLQRQLMPAPATP
ncbi:MAG: S9 family peptidase [Gemmatimonadetes bacterium]|nr:S9 family peptidase [Gemmatimonadota bacterium]